MFKWTTSIRALALLRRAVVALERQATAMEALANVALTESGLNRKQPKLVSIDTFDSAEASKRWAAGVAAKEAGVEP